MRNLLNWSLGMCVLYGTLSFTQTINSKILYKTLGFQYYSFLISSTANHHRKAKCNLQQLKWIIPFTLCMCTLNLLSSFCITVMPLAAFASFKKMTILFVWAVGVLMKSPLKFSKTQYICIAIITFGAILVGIQDIASGQAIGYIACICYNLSEAMSLQYSNFLSRTRQITPFDMLYFNALLSLPYYGSAMIYEHQLGDIYNYFQNASPSFYISFILMLVLGCTSELVANFVVMKISPFYKATVSNLKDIIILFASVQYFGDFHLSVQNVIGLFMVFAASLAYSLPISKHKQQYKQIADKPTQLEVDEQEFLRKIEDQIGQVRTQASQANGEHNVIVQKQKKKNKNTQNGFKEKYNQPLNRELFQQNSILNNIEDDAFLLQQLKNQTV